MQECSNFPQYSLAPNGFNFQNLDVGSNSTPQLVDVDNDGLLDIVSGELFGKISYFRNTGANLPHLLSLCKTITGAE